MVTTKRLYIIRHAKSRYAQPGESDFSRSLSDSGYKEIESATSKLKKTDFPLDAFFCSTALRTRQTTSEFCKHMQIDNSKIVYLEELYHASEDILKQTIAKLENDLDTVAIVAHNPGITEYVNSCQTKYQIDDVPTCGIFGIEAECGNWNEFDNSHKSIFYFDFPGLKK